MNEKENKEFLTKQIITYIGNKRSLLPFIGNAVDEAKKRLGKKNIACFDAFSGSGIVARFLKQHSRIIYANDLEDYSYLINECYLSNRSTIDWDLLESTLVDVKQRIKKEWKEGLGSLGDMGKMH